VIGVGGTLDINTGIKVASDTGCDVLNMSFGTPTDLIESDAPPHTEVIRYALAKDIIPIAAIGNSSREEDYFPAALPGVIAVGSMGDDGHRSDFSTWGRHIALCAPGDRIISAGLRGYRLSTGTSHAAPFVSGVAALLVARAARRGVRLDSDGARRALTESAQRTAPGASEIEVGSGLLDAVGALQRLDELLSER
jgi:subtilisin family serine protease